MSSIRLRGLSSESQLKQILDQAKSNSGSNLTLSYGLARGQGSHAATITFQNPTTKTKGWDIINKILKSNHNLNTILIDDTFHGITTLYSPECPDNEVSVECVPFPFRSRWTLILIDLKRCGSPWSRRSWG